MHSESHSASLYSSAPSLQSVLDRSQRHGFLKRSESFVFLGCCSASLTGCSITGGVQTALRKQTFGKGG